ncbi:hypothetical protein, partial [Bacillus thuringiensis]|uniref:hypothetical protein n=1 Tax=Bacillus thuringiensis TaxID=1428 RepID=UPI0011A88BD6
MENELGWIREYEFVVRVGIGDKVLDGSEGVRDVVKNGVGCVGDRIIGLVGVEKEIWDEFLEGFESVEKEVFV